MIKLYLTLICVIVSCTSEKQEVIIDNNLNCNFFDSNIIKSLLDNKNEQGLIELYSKYHFNDTTIIKRKHYNMIDVYKKGDSLIIAFNYINSYNKLIVLDHLFIVENNNITDIQYTYPKGKNMGTYFKSSIKFKKLILKDVDYNLGDTIYGFFEFETSKFKVNETLDSDYFKGYFVAIIRDKSPLFNIP